MESLDETRRRRRKNRKRIHDSTDFGELSRVELAEVCDTLRIFFGGSNEVAVKLSKCTTGNHFLPPCQEYSSGSAVRAPWLSSNIPLFQRECPQKWALERNPALRAPRKLGVLAGLGSHADTLEGIKILYHFPNSTNHAGKWICVANKPDATLFTELLGETTQERSASCEVHAVSKDVL